MKQRHRAPGRPRYGFRRTPRLVAALASISLDPALLSLAAVVAYLLAMVMIGSHQAP